MSSPLTTHVLDTSIGQPASYVSLALYRQEENENQELLARAVTDENGRVAKLIDSSVWREGLYRLRFDTKSYFARSGKECFYPYCDVTFVVRDKEAHYHVPLLLSPYGYSTYRGS